MNSYIEAWACKYNFYKGEWMGEVAKPFNSKTLIHFLVWVTEYDKVIVSMTAIAEARSGNKPGTVPSRRFCNFYARSERGRVKGFNAYALLEHSGNLLAAQARAVEEGWGNGKIARLVPKVLALSAYVFPLFLCICTPNSPCNFFEMAYEYVPNNFCGQRFLTFKFWRVNFAF